MGALKPRFSSEELQQIELVSWKRSETQVHKWSGLRLDAGEIVSRLVLDRNAADSREGPRLEVRWNTRPASLPKAAVEYHIAVMSGDETLATRTVPHKERGPQKTVFTLEDFEDLDEGDRFEASVRVTAVGRPDVRAEPSEEFILEFGVHEGAVSSTAGTKVRSLVEGALTIDSRENFEAAINTTVSQKCDQFGLAPTRQARGVGEEGAAVDPVQRRDRGGDMAFRPHRESPAV